jgi:molybdopterin-containing oxidoreductase family iron-sulfur binding subunit
VFDEIPSGAAALEAIVGGGFDTILILGGNPVATAPSDIDVAGALKKATSVHVGTHADETADACKWHLPRAHALESWGDTVAEDGTAAPTQPLIAPMYGGRTDAEILERLAGGSKNAYDLVRATWASAIGGPSAPIGPAFEAAWRRAVHDGLQPGSAVPPLPATISEAAAAAVAKAPEGAVEITFAPDPHAWDGRFANSGWLQELPDAISKMCWGNAAAISPATAKKLGVKSGDLVSVSANGGAVLLPALVVFGQADDSVQVTIGQGRKKVGKVGAGVGVDVASIRRKAALDIAGGTITKASGSTKLPITQGHFAMEGRPLVREQTVGQWAAEPGWAKHVVHHPPEINLFPGYEYHGHRWAMAIDLSLCTGCGSCVTACQAENNTPVLGPEAVIRNREMHWIRIDRYYEESEDEPRSVVQPMLCQHCENAPCEQVCPVNATTHSPEGLNEMTYNRCIGTKYCGNNCPYKVRRFNYFNYTADIPATTRLQLNPDVTVRSRGVMEKCSFCVQRINQAKIAAKTSEGRTKLKDGEVVTACQQACATGAIVFGDLNTNSQVGREVDRPRSYRILQELNVRPRMNYLARISNPSSSMEGK